MGSAAPSLVGLMLAPPSMPHPELALLGDGRDDCDAHARRSSSSVSAGRYQERRTRPTGYRLGQLIASPYACPPRARPGGSFLQRLAIVRLARRSGPTTMANTSRQPACQSFIGHVLGGRDWPDGPAPRPAGGLPTRGQHHGRRHHPARQPGPAEMPPKAAPAEGLPKARTRRLINRAKRTTGRGRTTPPEGQPHEVPMPPATWPQVRVPLTGIGQQMGAATSVGRDPHRGRQTVMDRNHRFRREGCPLGVSHGGSRASTPRNSGEILAMQISHGGSQGFKSPHLHPT